jgi:hypothetical protein
MSIRAFLMVSSLLAALPLGCSNSTPPPAPKPASDPGAGDAPASKKVIKKHAIPVGPSPDAIAPGP